MKTRRTTGGGRLTVSIIVSILLHLAMLPGLRTFLREAPAEQKHAKQQAAVMLVDGQKVLKQLQRQKRRALAQQSKQDAKPRPKPKKLKIKPPEKPKRQVVEIPPPREEAIPENARFASEYNSSVDREQVSARKAAPSPEMKKADRVALSTGRDRKGTLDGRRSAEKKVLPPLQSPAAPETKESAKKRSMQAQQKVTPPQKSKNRRPTLHEGKGPFSPNRKSARQSSPQNLREKAASVARAPSNWRTLLPNLGPRDLARKDGSIDRVEDVDEGDATFLNTREYRHAWFFNRVKRSVQQRWRAVDAHRRYDPYGRVYGVRDRVTVVEVTLSKDGGLEDIFVTKDSGVAFLDEAAVSAFRAAQPFPNPPEGLRDTDGLIRFKFGFHLAINGRGFRMFRYR